MKEQVNPFDELGSQLTEEEQDIQEKKQEARAKEFDYLIHKVFAQSEDGAKLLQVWVDEWIMKKNISIPQSAKELHLMVSDVSIQNFVRYLCVTCERVKNGEI